MRIEQEQKLSGTVRLLKALVPQIDDVLGYMEDNGGWLPLNDQFLSAVHNLSIKKWSEYYLDERKLKAIWLLMFVGEEGVKEITDPEKVRDDLKSDLTEFLEGPELTPPTDAELEEFKAEFAASDEATQTAITKQTIFMYLGFITSLFNYLALMVHGRTMCQLVADALGGDDDAYRRAVQIDRTVLTLPYFQDRLLKAQFSNDAHFLKTVGDSLKRPILSSKIRYRTLWLTFAILEDEGLIGLPHDQILDICEQIGVYGKAYGVEDVGHLRKRLRDYRRYQRTSNIF